MTGDQSAARTRPVKETQPIYITLAERSNDVLDLQLMWRKLVDGKWQIVGVTAIFAAAAVAYSFLATPIYRAEVVLAPVVENGIGGTDQLGGLASLAGITLAGKNDGVEALAILQSKQFTEEFIREKQLLPILFHEGWDSDNQRWRNANPERQPDLQDGVRIFSKDVRTVSKDSRTGLVTLAVDWTEPNRVAEWSTELVVRINERMRRRAIEESERKLTYLNKQLDSAPLVELRQAISRVIEEQISAVMLARAQNEYAFRVIDPAVTPKNPIWPKPILIIIVSIACGGFFGAFISLVRSAR